MASKSTTERTIKTKLDGESTGGLRRAVREQERELARLRRAAEKEQALFVSATTRGADKISSALATSAKGVLALGSAVGTLQSVGTAVAGTVAVASSLSGTLLALPGIAATGAAGVGVLKLATMGFAEALEASDAKEWTEATKNMAPAAIKTAEAIRAQNDRLTALRKLVQDRFFAGFDTDVRALADKYFPILEKGTGEIAGNFNLMGRNASKALLAPSSVDAVNKILDATTKTTKELEPALGNVVGGLLELGGVGARRTITLGKAVSNVTEDFRAWVAEGVKTGKINALIDEGVESAQDLGRVFVNLGQIGQKLWSGLNQGERDFLGGIEETTQAVEDFLDSVEGQEAIRALGETLKVTADVARDVLAAALREVGPLVRDAAPAIQEFARGVGEFLVNAIQTVGPLLQGMAQFLSANKETLGDLVPLLLAAALAYKGLKVATEVKGWLAGIPTLFDDTAKKANAASDAIGDAKSGKGVAGRLGNLKALGAGAILAGAVVSLDNLNTSAANSEDNLNTVDDTLHNIAGAGKEIASLNFDGIFDDIAKEWETVTRGFTDGSTPAGRLWLAWTNGKFNDAQRLRLELSVGANTYDAQIETKRLVDFVNKTSGTVNINGNNNGAAFALRRILEEIAQGKETVTIDGKAVPAEEALRRVIDQINQGSGTVRLNGNDVPAGEALDQLLRRVGGSSANIKVGADTSAAQGVIDSFIRLNNGKTVQIYTSALGSGGIASAGRLATGGRPFFDGRVSGPGTSTSDTAGFFRLSNDEHVWNAREVAAIGGHSAMYRLRAAALAGRIRGFAGGGTPRYLHASIPAPRAPRVMVSTTSSAPEVRVYLGTREITDVVDTRIEYAQRESNRAAVMNPGGAW